MSSLSKWILALVIALSIVAIVQASQQQQSYLPIVYKQLGLTPTRTATVTRTPTITPTVTKTPTPLAGLEIIKIVYLPIGDPIDEYVEIKNKESRTAQMKGAILKDETGNKYTFPSFTLSPGSTVRVWTGKGSNDSHNLYWGRSEPVWNDTADCAYLRDSMKNKLDTFCYSNGVFFRP